MSDADKRDLLIGFAIGFPIGFFIIGPLLRAWLKGGNHGVPEGS